MAQSLYNTKQVGGEEGPPHLLVFLLSFPTLPGEPKQDWCPEEAPGVRTAVLEKCFCELSLVRLRVVVLGTSSTVRSQVNCVLPHSRAFRVSVDLGLQSGCASLEPPFVRCKESSPVSQTARKRSLMGQGDYANASCRAGSSPAFHGQRPSVILTHFQALRPTRLSS